MVHTGDKYTEISCHGLLMTGEDANRCLLATICKPDLRLERNSECFFKIILNLQLNYS